MKKLLLAPVIASLIFSTWGCGIGLNRIEKDTYTISHRDTTTEYHVQNAPGNRDNGVIFPSSRTFKSERYLLQQDSVVEREYPDFIRMGAFESVGFLLGGDKDYALGSGLFGIFHDFDKDYTNYRGDPDKVFVGGLYRIGIGEWRLRWFRDAKNWTIGSSAFEAIVPDARLEKTLLSIAPIYVRKRWFLSEDIPYLCLTGAVGIGYYPSQYINTSLSLDLGSLSGLNFRAYAGFAAGQHSASAPQVKESNFSNEAQKTYIPYAGIGVSLLDFFNLVEETETEWKDYKHSGWDIGLMQIGFLSTGSDYSSFAEDDEEGMLNGLMLRFLNASTAIPVLNNQFYAGTSLFSMIALGKYEWGVGVLPIRVGYWQTILADELTTEPFMEFNYYPSSFVNIGNRVNLRISEQINVSFIIGYASGSTSEVLGNNLVDNFGAPGDFSGTYIGLTIGFMDKIFFPEEIRYNK